MDTGYLCYSLPMNMTCFGRVDEGITSRLTRIRNSSDLFFALHVYIIHIYI